MKSPQSLDAQMKAQPNPVTRSSPKELRKLLRQMIRFDERYEYPKVPKSILHWQFCWLHFQTRVCYSGFRVSKRFPPQDLEKSTRISSVRLILCHEGCLFRQNPPIQRMRLIFNGKNDNVEYEKYDVLS